MVKVYISCISHVPDPKECPEILHGLSQERRCKINRQKRLGKRRQSLGAGLLLKKILALYGISEQDVRLGENGKPEVDGIYFNLAHSGEFVICAVSDSSPVGCDIERIKGTDGRVAERFFGLKENAYLASVSQENRDEASMRLWTMKESYVKMTTEGLRLSVKDFEMDLDGPIRVYRNGVVQACMFKEYEVPGYKVTICSEDAKFSDMIWIDI